MKKNSSLVLLMIMAMFLLSSCMTTKTQVGQFREIQGKEYTYAKGKQIWLFWGIVPLGRTSVSTPSDGNCEVVTRHNFVDVLVTTLTGGIVSTHTIKVRAKRKSDAPVNTNSDRPESED